jgi:hypothetical protein
MLTRRLAVLTLGLTGALGVLLLAGVSLPGPVVLLADGGGLRWTGPSAPADLVVGVVHAAAVATTAYLLVATVLELAVAVVPRCRRHSSTRVRLPVAGALVLRMAGSGLALSATVVPAVAALEPPPVVMHVVVAHPSPPPTMHAVGAPEPAEPPLVSRPDVDAGVWVVRPGDNLWHVAQVTLRARSRRPVTDGAVAEYLDRLVARNARALEVPGHPELVYPGQRFVLPPVT